jgi:hypothetical protein
MLGEEPVPIAFSTLNPTRPGLELNTVLRSVKPMTSCLRRNRPEFGYLVMPVAEYLVTFSI